MFLRVLAHLPFLPTNNSLMTWLLSAVDSCFRDTCTCRCHILTSTVRITITRFSVHGTSVLQEGPSCSNVVSPSHPRSKKSLVFLGTAFTQCCFENYYTFFSGPVKLEPRLSSLKTNGTILKIISKKCQVHAQKGRMPCVTYLECKRERCSIWVYWMLKQRKSMTYSFKNCTTAGKH